MGKFNEKQREYIVKEISKAKKDGSSEITSGAFLAVLSGVTLFFTKKVVPFQPQDVYQTILFALLGAIDAITIGATAISFARGLGLEKRAQDLEDSLKLNDLSESAGGKVR